MSGLSVCVRARARVRCGGQSSISRFGRFTAGETEPGTHWIGGWVDLRAGLDTYKILPLLGTESRSSDQKPKVCRQKLFILLKVCD